MVKQASSCDLKVLVQKLIPEAIGKEIEKETQGIYPLQNVYIRKVKILKAPKFDLGKLMEVREKKNTFWFYLLWLFIIEDYVKSNSVVFEMV